MRSPVRRKKRTNAISKPVQVALAFLVTISSPSCERKNTSVQERDEPSRRAPDQRGRKVLEADQNHAAAEAVRRMIEREKISGNPAFEDPGRLINEYATALPERKAEILALLGSDGSPAVWDFLCKAAGHQDQNIRLAALDALALHQGGDTSMVIAQGLSFPDEETRALAATLLGKRARDPIPWQKAAIDPSNTVRVTYLAAVEAAPNRIKIASAKSALDSGKPQLRREAASVLGGAKSKEAADLLIELLDDPDVYPVANDALFYFFGRGFDSAAEAQAWLVSQKELIWD